MPKADVLTVQEFDRFISRLRVSLQHAQEADAMRAAISRVVGGAATAAAPKAPLARSAAAAKPIKAGKTGRGPGRPRKVIDTAAILSELGKSKEGLSSTQLATRIGEKSRPRMLAALDRLRTDGRVKLVGVRRKARWHVA